MYQRETLFLSQDVVFSTEWKEMMMNKGSSPPFILEFFVVFSVYYQNVSAFEKNLLRISFLWEDLFWWHIFMVEVRKLVRLS